jgi:serine/threonine protein kinase
MMKLSNDKNSFTEPQIWKIIYHISLGLAAVHGSKSAHRDLKPENILITLDGTYKISDFGSATNKFYENINNNIRNEIIFDISRNTSPGYRAPEQLDLYTGYPINEKVDIWALGLILYNLLFDAQPFMSMSGSGENSSKIHQIVKGSIVLTEEMVQSYNPLLIKLLKNMMKPNPSERVSAHEIVFFIEQNRDTLLGAKNENKIMSNIKRSYSLAKAVSDATAKIFKRHSTQFWVIKLMSEDLTYPPKLKYIKLLVTKAWSKRKKVYKLFQNISTRPIHYFSFVALKSLYVLHSYIFLGPAETLNPENFNLEEFLTFFCNLWSTRYSTGNYDKDEILKNSHVTKFIVSYSEFLKAKVAYHKRYPYIENNFSIDNLSSRNNFDFSHLVDKKFITDTISLYSLMHQKSIQVPIIVNLIGLTLDNIIQIFNEELTSLFNLIFYILIAYKNYYSFTLSQNSDNDKNDSQLKIFDSQFIEITNKAKEYCQKIKKFRSDINSKNILKIFTGAGSDSSNSNIFVEYLKSLDNNLKFFPNNEFNLKNFFSASQEKEIVGIKLNPSIGKLISNNSFSEGCSISGNNDISQNSFNNNFMNKRSMDDTCEKGNSSSPSKKVMNEINSLQKNKNQSSAAFYNIPNLKDENSFRICNSSKKDFEFSEEKFRNSKVNFDFEQNTNRKTSSENVNPMSRRSCTPGIAIDNSNNNKQCDSRISNQNNNFINFNKNLNERGRSLDTKNITSQSGALNNVNNNYSQVHQVNGNNQNKNLQLPLNNSQSLFNHNFFSKSNEDNIIYNNVLNNNQDNMSNSNIKSVRKISDDTSSINSNQNVMDVLNEIFESNKGVIGGNSNKNVLQNLNFNPINSNCNKNLFLQSQLNNTSQNMANQGVNQGVNQNFNILDNSPNMTVLNNNQRKSVPVPVSVNPSLINYESNKKVLNETDNKLNNKNYMNVNNMPTNFNQPNPNFQNLHNMNNTNNMTTQSQSNNAVNNTAFIGNNQPVNNKNIPQNMMNQVNYQQRNSYPLPMPNMGINNNNNNLFKNEYYESIYSMNKNMMGANPYLNSNFSNMNNMNMVQLNQTGIPMGQVGQINNSMMNINNPGAPQNFSNMNMNNVPSQMQNSVNNMSMNKPTVVNSPYPQQNSEIYEIATNKNLMAQAQAENTSPYTNKSTYFDPFSARDPQKTSSPQMNPNINIPNINNINLNDFTNQNEDNNYESVKSQFPQMSIINIQNNYNDIKVFKEVNIETLANQFLKEEFSKKNLQWLISSKDIKYGKQIGFGGSSEVFRADYRGTEVAVKKLRILEVKEENLKEFKREVSSLIMLRHPNLVLFMGAM